MFIRCSACWTGKMRAMKHLLELLPDNVCEESLLPLSESFRDQLAFRPSMARSHDGSEGFRCHHLRCAVMSPPFPSLSPEGFPPTALFSLDANLLNTLAWSQQLRIGELARPIRPATGTRPACDGGCTGEVLAWVSEIQGHLAVGTNRSFQQQSVPGARNLEAPSLTSPTRSYSASAPNIQESPRDEHFSGLSSSNKARPNRQRQPEGAWRTPWPNTSHPSAVSMGGGDSPILFAFHHAPRRASSMSLCCPNSAGRGSRKSVCVLRP
jgi:hypothetical protein